MTVTPGPRTSETVSPAPPALDPADHGRAFDHLATRQICPFLTIEGGGWRSSNPSRDHRCGAVTPAVPLAIDKQRRLCLADAHVACATYLAATGASPSGETGTARAALGRPGAGATPTVTRWSLVRTVPVVLDRGRVPASVGTLARDRRGGQLALAGLLLAAFAAVAIARLSGSGGPSLPGAVGSTSPSAARPSVVATAPASTPTAAPSETPTQAPSVAPSASPTSAPTPSPSATHRTYTVQSGDSLSRIASKFGTTVSAIAELNHIAKKDYGRLQVGQVLLIP